MFHEVVKSLRVCRPNERQPNCFQTIELHVFSGKNAAGIKRCSFVLKLPPDSLCQRSFVQNTKFIKLKTYRVAMSCGP